MAKEILCPFCFERTEASQLLFRCFNRRCSGQIEDKIYADFQGLAMPPKMGLTFLPQKKGLSKFLGNSNNREANCPTCDRETSKRACPKCHSELKYVGDNIDEKMIAVIGGRSSGKSSYISVLIDRLENEIGKNFNAGVLADSDRTRKRYEDGFYKPVFREKKLLQATTSAITDSRVKTPMVFRVTFNHGGKRKAINLVLFDTAGEDMENLDIMSTEARYICEADGIVFLLDPLQIETVRQLVPDNLPERLPSADPNRIVERLYELHEEKLKIKQGQKLAKPVAFTLSKSDALFPAIDPSSALHHSGDHFGYLNLSDVQSVHTEISTYLEEWMGSVFDNKVKTYFDCYRYFAISAFGKAPDGDRLESISPLRVEDPLLWVFNQFKVIEAKK
jgi:GTPase SAR1 family protein